MQFHTVPLRIFRSSLIICTKLAGTVFIPLAYLLAYILTYLLTYLLTHSLTIYSLHGAGYFLKS